MNDKSENNNDKLILEYAQKLYGMHKSSLIRPGTKEQEILNKKIMEYATKIENIGGTVSFSEKDILGTSNPIIYDTKKKILKDMIGFLESQYINDYIIKDINGFIKHY